MARSHRVPLPPRAACIDIGSNTTRLLVAERDRASGRLREVVARRVFTHMGAGGGPVGAAKAAEVAEVVAAQLHAARGAGAHAVRIVGTAALRRAPDRDAVVAAIEDRAGVTVEVVGTAEEARLAFEGAIRTLGAPPDGPVGVVDVGGGSCELVCGTAAGGADWSASFPVGSGVLTDEHVRGDPPSTGELAAARRCAAAHFATADCPHPAAAYAVGGGATSLARLAGPVLDRAALRRCLALLTAGPRAAVAARDALHPARVRLLPAGIVLLDEAAAALHAPLRLGDGGLREGAVLALLDTVC